MIRDPLVLRTSALLLVVSLFGGCASSDPGFRDVEGAVGSRTGKRLRWMQNSGDVTAAHEATRLLLKHRLTADSAAQIALLNNRRLQASFEQIGISAAEYRQASSPSNPSFSGLIRFPDSGGISNIEFSVAQNLLDLLLIPLKRRLAKAALDAAKLEVSREVLELVTETKIAFYNLQARQQLLSRLKLIVETNESAADLAKRMHEAGNIPDVELANQQATYSQSHVDVAQAEAQIRSERERMNRLMGVWGADTNWSVGDRLPEIPPSEISLSRLESKALEQRFDLALARQNVASIGFAGGVQRATRFLPAGIDAGVNTERETDGSRLTGPTLDLRLPIFDQGQAGAARLAAQYRRAQNELEAIAVEARSEVREARDKVLANRELARYYGQVLLPQRVQIVNTTQLQYNAMQRSPSDLLLAKERELNAERGYVEAWRDYWIARAELEMALKGGSPGGGNSRRRDQDSERPRLAPLRQDENGSNGD